MRLNQVTVGATDFRQSVDFYTRLGLRLIVSAREEYARFDMPEGDATLSVHVQDEVPETGPMIYFEVGDVDAVVARLRAAGIVFESDPVDQPWLWREARLRDPAGNRLCIFHAGVNRRDPPWRLPVTD
ncbi:VOC family protein [Croceicoccus sp. YJ47]|uniref:VOC family protein n=1 Tax=Croceicoccus sp. YJ47 TaxID=2798724 RepID=UPI001F369E5E|nr:VOC family protein [Croceicoccus sp. YJ47]